MNEGWWWKKGRVKRKQKRGYSIVNKIKLLTTPTNFDKGKQPHSLPPSTVHTLEEEKKIRSTIQ